jgi:hypothetical protein
VLIGVAPLCHTIVVGMQVAGCRQFAVILAPSSSRARSNVNMICASLLWVQARPPGEHDVVKIVAALPDKPQELCQWRSKRQACLRLTVG